ncbi:MAG: 50S ribosomal protein L25, partial [Gammaproteobacteria bacterium]|nr:50S ribosomal protein L25 [Gammaproteobacteria bacterium]
HADFLRVRADVELTVNVPLHFMNEDTCAGVRLENGQVSHLMNELEVTCLPRNLPEYIEVDMAELHVGDTLHISDLKLPEGVTSVEFSHGEENDQAVATVTEIRLQAEEPEEAADAAGDEGADSTDGADDSSDDEDKSGE